MYTRKVLILLGRSPSIIHIFPLQILSLYMDHNKPLFRFAFRAIGPPLAADGTPGDKMDLVLDVNILQEMKMSL
jgi:hypothetical protein